MIYLYDGSFYGLLTCIYKHFYGQKATGIYSIKTFKGSLLDPVEKVASNQDLAEKVEKGIRDRCSYRGYKEIYYAFLSSDYHKDMYILRYLIRTFKSGRTVDRLYSDDVVVYVKNLYRKVARESHRFLGFVRFQEVGDTLYAKLSPDHRILPLLASHFADRMPEEKVIIHDLARKEALIIYQGQWEIRDFSLDDTLPVGKKEQLIQGCWQAYFDHIGIEERANKALQQQFVPLKHRAHLTEFQSGFLGKEKST